MRPWGPVFPGFVAWESRPAMHESRVCVRIVRTGGRVRLDVDTLPFGGAEWSEISRCNPLHWQTVQEALADWCSD
jgi:hypothetical protein